MSAPTDQELSAMVARLIAAGNALLKYVATTSTDPVLVEWKKAVAALRAVGVDVQDDSWGER